MLSAIHIEIIRHSLGLDDSRKAYRNGFAAEPGSPDHATIEEMVTSGHMKRGREIPGGLVYFHVTELGKQAINLKGRA